MKDHWQTHMQIGVVHGMLFPACLGGDGPVVETLAAICHDPFFEAVDVGPIRDEAARRESAALLRDCRMAVSFACQPVQLREGLDLNAADAAERARAVSTVCSHLDQARELGAERFNILSGRNVAAEKRSQALAWLIDSVKQICRAARERAGLPVVLEIFDHEVDKKALVGTCEQAARLAADVRRDFPDFGLLHDLSHIYLCGESPSRHLPLIREYLVAVHLGNSVSQKGHPLHGDTHPLFGIAGGDSDVPQVRMFLKTLFDIGFLRPGRRPIVGFELRTPGTTGNASPQTVVANLKRTFQRAWWGWRPDGSV